MANWQTKDSSPNDRHDTIIWFNWFYSSNRASYKPRPQKHNSERLAVWRKVSSFCTVRMTAMCLSAAYGKCLLVFTCVTGLSYLREGGKGSVLMWSSESNGRCLRRLVWTRPDVWLAAFSDTTWRDTFPLFTFSPKVYKMGRHHFSVTLFSYWVKF
jgi:hypothetical protein